MTRSRYLTLIEGDLAEHMDGSLWVVKGCVHPPGGYVALPRVVESRKTKRYSESVEVVRRYYAHYVTYLAELGREVPVVPADDLIGTRRWMIEGRRGLSEPHGELLRLFEEVGLECGIAGSHLGGYSRPESDVDVHCLDSPGAYERIADLHSSGELQRVDFSDIVREVIDVAELLDVGVHVRLMASKLLQGRYRGRRITIRVVNCERVGEVLGPYVSTTPVDMVVRVTESDYRTPVIMGAEVVRASTPAIRKVRLLSHRLRFAEIPVGTMLDVVGYLRVNALGTALVNLDESDVLWVHVP